MQEKQIQIQFKLVDVQQIQFATLTNKWPEGEMQVTNQIQFSSDNDNRVVRCMAHFEYKQNDITMLILSVQTIYEFARESWSAMYQLQDDSWILPAGLLHHMADITIGSARGILAARCEDEGFPRVVLPLMNPAQFIKDNLRLPRIPKTSNMEETPNHNN